MKNPFNNFVMKIVGDDKKGSGSVNNNYATGPGNGSLHRPLLAPRGGGTPTPKIQPPPPMQMLGR